MDIFAVPYMERSLITAGTVGVLCSVVGVFVVLRGLSFLGDGIAHAAFTGIALALLLGGPPLGGALVICSLFAVGVSGFSRVGRIAEDATIGIFFSASLALALLLMSVGGRSASEIMGYLFGGILTVSSAEMQSVLVVSGTILLLLVILSKELLAITFDEAFAARSGLPTRLLTYFLRIVMAVAIVFSLKVSGVVLVSSLLVTPAATALQLTREFRRVLWCSAIVGCASSVGGVLLSFMIDSPPGATVVLVATSLFLVAAACRRGRGETLFR